MGIQLKETRMGIIYSPKVAWLPIIGLLMMAGLTYALLTSVVKPAMNTHFASVLASLSWSISVLFFALTITVTFMTSSQEIWGRLPSKKWKLLVLMLLLAVVAAVWYGLPASQGLKFNEKLLGGTVYRVAEGARIFVTGVEILGVFGLVALAVAVSLILTWNSGVTDHFPETSLADLAASLARDQQSIHLLLYAGALALVAGTLEASALYSWATCLVPSKLMPNDVAYFTQIKDIPRVMGMLNGSFYSILLATIFIPAFSMLRGIADGLAHIAMPEATVSDRNKWLAEHAVGDSIPRQLLSAFAVLSPMIAGGPLASLLESVTKILGG